MRAADATLVELEQGRDVDDPPPELAALFRPSVQPYLRSWLALDPIELVAHLDMPVLIIHGDADLQVPVDDAHRLAECRTGPCPTRVVVIADADHLLVAPGGDTVDQRVPDAIVRFAEALGTTWQAGA